MSAASGRQVPGRPAILIIPTDDAQLGEDVARLDGRRLLVNADASREDQLRAIADACLVLVGERSDWARPTRRPRHLSLVKPL